jgi:hypothetical protein
MAAVKKAIIEKGYGDVIVVDNVKSHDSDPLFYKKSGRRKKGVE